MISEETKKDVLKEIKPTVKEHRLLQKDVEELIAVLELTSKKLHITSSFLVGGSFGKGTYLKDSFDVDIFCRFDLSYENSQLSDLAKQILDLANLSYIKQKGSRDYFSGDYKNIHFELVPNYAITDLSDAQNSTDYSPQHVAFVKHKAEENPSLLDEIRLTKQFLKAQKLYGAESYINGFSGHVIDLLIIYYGSFTVFLESLKTWKEQTIIDVAKHYSSSKDVLSSLDDSKVSNLILVDPILKDRNAARALGVQKYFELIYLVTTKNSFDKKDFLILVETSTQFLKKNIQFSQTHNFSSISYEISLDTIESEDIAGSKLLKLFSKVESYYTKVDFVIFAKYFFISFSEKKCIFFFHFEQQELPSLKLLLGPQLYRHDAVKKFLKDKEGFFVKKDRICAYQKRDIISLTHYDSLNENNFKKLSSKNLDFISSLQFTFFK